MLADSDWRGKRLRLDHVFDGPWGTESCEQSSALQRSLGSDDCIRLNLDRVGPMYSSITRIRAELRLGLGAPINPASELTILSISHCQIGGYAL